MKTCSKCEKLLPFSSFFKNKTRKDGLQAYCKICKRSADVKDYTLHKEKRSAYHREYRLKNHEQTLQTLKKYRDNNKPIRTALQSKRRASELQRTPKWLTQDELNDIKEFYIMAKELEAVFPWKQCVDHIIPLQGRTVSGLHVPSNLQILSAKANMEKGNRYYG
jgi:hypothetical protein